MISQNVYEGLRHLPASQRAARLSRIERDLARASRRIDVDEITDTLGTVADRVARHLSPDIARRIEAIRSEITHAVASQRPAPHAIPSRRIVIQWA